MAGIDAHLHLLLVRILHTMEALDHITIKATTILKVWPRARGLCPHYITTYIQSSLFAGWSRLLPIFTEGKGRAELLLYYSYMCVKTVGWPPPTTFHACQPLLVLALLYMYRPPLFWQETSRLNGMNGWGGWGQADRDDKSLVCLADYLYWSLICICSCLKPAVTLY